MVRAPYPARVAAGLVVTAIEETRKLPTLIVTLPMTAVSETLQLAMRAQQGIAELAIKGDAALELLFDHPEEQPAWAHFDDDENDSADLDAADLDAADLDAADTVVPIESGTRPTGAPRPVTPADPPAAPTESAEEPRADAGRFALYSSAPADLIDSAHEPDPVSAPADDVEVPDVVESTDYDSLTLAQLRAKLRTVGVDDLAELLTYERNTRNRTPFVTMIDNRISAAESKHSPTP